MSILDAYYLSLSQNLAFKAQLGVTSLKKFLKGIRYDYSCPAFQDVTNRHCVQYAVYIYVCVLFVMIWRVTALCKD